MKKKPSAIVISVFISLILTSSALAAGVPQAVLDAGSSVVYIEVSSATEIFSGSGFVIKNDSSGTYIATNNHVVEDNPNGVSVWTGENEKRTASVEARSEEYDLAIIKLSEPLNVKELVLCPDAEQGDEVFAVGYPAAANALSQNEAHLSSEATITNGIISAIKSMKNVDYGPNVKLLQINAEINLGNSGGPLLNDKGQVVGINTYGVLNSQGIFGAISASEIIMFIDNNQLFKITTITEDATNWVFLSVLASVIAAAVICGIIFIPRLRNKKRKTDQNSKEELWLNEYLLSLKSDIDAYSAVSMMMPIILYLRNKHNNGAVFLKLSPSKISVTKDGCKLRKTDDMPADEFVAPEQSKGGFAGVRADVYGVCAVLRHMLTFRSKNIEGDGITKIDPAVEGLQKIISKGLSENPQDRFASMQDLIFELSPFNTGISEQALIPFMVIPQTTNIQRPSQNKPYISINKPKPKRKKLIIILTTVGAGLAIVIFIAYSAVNYMMAMNHAKNNDFKEACDEIVRVPFANVIFPQDFNFIGAGGDMLNRDYDAAISRFKALEDYSGAAELIKEAKYRKASMLADEHNYDSAIGIYKELGGYKDSAELINSTSFRKASYYLSMKKYEDALLILQSLSGMGYTAADSKIQELHYVWGCDYLENEQYVEAYRELQLAGNYEDAVQILSALKDTIYYQAIDDYRSSQYGRAEYKLDLIGDYLDSKNYLVLIEAHISGGYDGIDLPESWHVTEFDSTKLWPLIGFEDTAEIIMSSWYAHDFLVGRWEGNSRYFIMKDNGQITYDLPYFNYGDYYRIEDSKFLLFKEKTPDNTKTLFKISIINQNCIQVLAYKNHKTYTLYRQ